jgi:hypothetical protein
MEIRFLIEVIFYLVIPYLLYLWSKKERKWYNKYLTNCRDIKNKRYQIKKMIWFREERYDV